MPQPLALTEVLATGLDEARAAAVLKELNRGLSAASSPEECWQKVSKTILTPEMPFGLHKLLYERIYSEWDSERAPPPAWFPTQEEIKSTNLYELMRERGFKSYEELFSWTIKERADFWLRMIERLEIRFDREFTSVADLSDAESPRWLLDAKLNIASSCFKAPEDSLAIIHQGEARAMARMSYGQLHSLTNRVANGLRAAGFNPGDSIAVDLPMNAESVAIYLGIIKAGCTAVSIADSFAAEEIRVRLDISGAKAIFTQDQIRRGGKILPLYSKVVAAEAPPAIVLSLNRQSEKLRAGDMSWQQFLSDDETFTAVSCDPDAPTNILFSSGTTGEPKAIPWTHTTPIKCAVDAHLHHDVKPGNVIAWPTSLGWMMGPWLIYASLINRAAMALFDGAPTGREFGEFVQNAGVTMLGLVPSLVRAWKRSGCMSGLNWSAIRAFSSTGEPSNAEDMLFLMALAGYRPIIEYCGGTEIGGVYITGTLLHPCAPTIFTTPAPGIDFLILDENGRPTNKGEVFLIPPSIGLSTTLLNQDHHEVYFEGTPKTKAKVPLRRHGDQIEELQGRGVWGKGYRIHGRVDDTMNLSGIKISSAEIERLLNTVDGVSETAAIAVQPAGEGLSVLVIYTVLVSGIDITRDDLRTRFQTVIGQRLNPLFKIHDVVIVEALPRTASNKTMRRVLRKSYDQQG